MRVPQRRPDGEGRSGCCSSSSSRQQRRPRRQSSGSSSMRSAGQPVAPAEQQPWSQQQLHAMHAAANAACTQRPSMLARTPAACAAALAPAAADVSHGRGAIQQGAVREPRRDCDSRVPCWHGDGPAHGERRALLCRCYACWRACRLHALRDKRPDLTSMQQPCSHEQLACCVLRAGSTPSNRRSGTQARPHAGRGLLRRSTCTACTATPNPPSAPMPLLPRSQHAGGDLQPG